MFKCSYLVILSIYFVILDISLCFEPQSATWIARAVSVGPLSMARSTRSHRHDAPAGLRRQHVQAQRCQRVPRTALSPLAFPSRCPLPQPPRPRHSRHHPHSRCDASGGAPPLLALNRNPRQGPGVWMGSFLSLWGRRGGVARCRLQPAGCPPASLAGGEHQPSRPLRSVVAVWPRCEWVGAAARRAAPPPPRPSPLSWRRVALPRRDAAASPRGGPRSRRRGGAPAAAAPAEARRNDAPRSPAGRCADGGYQRYTAGG